MSLLPASHQTHFSKSYEMPKTLPLGEQLKAFSGSLPLARDTPILAAISL